MVAKQTCLKSYPYCGCFCYCTFVYSKVFGCNIYYAISDYSWSTQVLPVINVKEDIDKLNTFVMDCIDVAFQNVSVTIVLELSDDSISNGKRVIIGGKVSSDEIGLKVSDTGLVLPCGSTAIWEK